MDSHTPPLHTPARPARPALSARTLVAAIGLCAVALASLAWVLDIRLVDDTYIFLRYARNIADGNGAVFNVGERVEGYSSPLWTMILAGAGVAYPHYEAIAYTLGLLCGAGILFLTLRHLRQADPGFTFADAIIFGLGLATCPILIFWSASGMDMALFVLLLTASLLSIQHDREKAGLSARTAVLLTLATLARMEGVMLATLAGVIFLCERRSVRMLVFYALAMIAFLLVRFAYYGTWVPNTYHAKVTFGLAHRLNAGLTYFLPAMRANVLLIASLIVALVVVWRQRLHRQVPIVLFGGWILLWCAYVMYVGGDNFLMFRFLLPIVPAVFLLLARCWFVIRRARPPTTRRAGLAALAVVFLASNALTYREQAQSYFGDTRLAQAWKNVGQWLDANTPPETVIATIIPGAIGYFGKRTTIDMLGLTDQRVSMDGLVYENGAHGHSRYHTDYIFERSPDIILYHSSGRFEYPVYDDPEKIPHRSGYALYHFVTDPRCKERYAYTTARLDNGLLVEMMKRTTPPRVAAGVQKDALNATASPRTPG